MKPYRAAVVGCGRIGVLMESDPKRTKPATHAGAYAANPRTELAALVELDAARLEQAGRLFPKAARYASAAEMLSREDPDIVSVCTMPGQHRGVVEACAARGAKAVVCEKPIADSLEDGGRIIEACRRSGTLLFINHMRRFDPVIRRAREKVLEGELGEVLQARFLYTAGLFNTGSHMVDLLRYFLGDVAWAEARVNDRVSAPPGELNVDGWLGFASGAAASLQALEVKDYSVFDMVLHGRKGRLALRRFGFEASFTPVRDCAEYSGYRELDEDGPHREGSPRSMIAPMTEHVAACLDGREQPLSRGEDGLAALRVLLALKESAESGGRRITMERTEAAA